ncbi:MAG: helix-turn-helix transcriptional regulator [Chloroflexi bacterium]|nr:helix-turn-helix transcriptional regulator [Chloroflexota bacterium]
MATRDSAAARGVRRSRLLRDRTADGLGNARRGAGLSIREVARRVGVSADTIRRLELADPHAMTIDLVGRVAPILGMELAASLYPAGDPVRDRGHLALLARLRARVPSALRWRVEVPVPITGDLRSGDAMVTLDTGDIVIEAETRLDDLQAVERKGAAKARDLGAIRLVLLVADTRHNRRVIRDHPELRERFPVDTRACLARLAKGQDPGGDALVIL